VKVLAFNIIIWNGKLPYSPGFSVKRWHPLFVWQPTFLDRKIPS
jgi:hypothetical protein